MTRLPAPRKKLGPKGRDFLVRSLCRAGVDDETTDRLLELCEQPAEDERPY
jgi:hypothetical protein